MELIKKLFSQSKDIYRTIEKVITYSASQENRLKSEISEYVVTESIENQFENLLSKMQLAMDNGGQNEVGVWVSGFYGSGKSSFTKYLGLAFDESKKIGDEPFLKHLQNRFEKPQTKALLATVAKKFPAAVVLLDLASEMLAGATMEDVSTVLYYKALQWAGYSRNLKVAAFERKLIKDRKFDEFKNTILKEIGVEWNAIQNDPLVIDSVIPEIAHRLYPAIFKTETSFSTETGDFFKFENERVTEMLDIIKEASGKKYVIFIIDEVGQYVGSRQNLMLNLDGLAKNIKNIGDGKVWLIGTAQQTLTEDDPRAALNSPELYKLKDRFPIQINLESSDIREICYRRLLGKSAAGEKELNSLFDQHGQALRHNTKLENAKYYDSDFNKDSFAKLYPFLPSHFDILLHLLGALAKSTGGIGLRSAIKVVQDILIDNMDGNEPIAEKPIGTLVTSTTLYDALEKDIRRASQSIYNSVEKVKVRFPGGGLHLQIAKTVAILQIMNNLPTTITNVTSLLHPSVAAPGMLDEVKKAANELVSDTFVPFGEQDGQLRFFSEKLNEIEKEKSQLPVRTVETRRIFSESLKEIFTPLPSVNLHGSLNVKSGVKTLYGSVPFSLAGDNETLQMHVEFADSKDYETQKASAINESRSKNSQNVIFLICRTAPEIEEKLADIFRCREICQRFRTEPDQEIKEYCASQNDRSIKLAAELQHLLKKLLSKGSFVFRGQITAVDSLDNDILESSKKNLAKAAPQVFDRYQEAPVRAETGLAEKFLRTENLNLITVQIDPMGLIKKVNGKPTIDIGNKALISIKDYIEKNGSAEGKRLLEIFSDAPFGWSQDTLRYLLAALLISGEIKLKVAGREVTVNGQSAIDALKSNVSFKNVGVSLRNEKPSMDVLARAAERLTELTGEQIIPLENDIGKAAVKHLSQFQTRFAPLGGKLSSLGISGEDKIQSINKDIADILFTDGSDVYKLFGGVESELCEKLKWAGEIEKSFSHGLDKTLSDLKKHYDEINDMPDCDIPQKLKNDLSDEFEKYKDIISGENFYGHSTDLNSLLTSIKSKVRKAAEQMIGEQKKSIDSLKQELVLIPFWDQFNLQEQNEVISDIENLEIKVESDLHGIRQLIKHDMVIYNKLKEYKQKIISEGQTRHVKKLETEREKAKKQGKQTLTREIKIPASVKSIEQLDDILTQLNKLKNEFAVYSKIEINIKIEG